MGNFKKMKNILVTGGTGFIGSNICKSLVKQNYKTLSVLCGKLDAAPLAYKKIKNIIKKIN